MIRNMKTEIGRREFLKIGLLSCGAFILNGKNHAFGQNIKRISIATGGMGGVWFPLGGGIANLISKYIPGVEAAAEVTSAAVDNCKLVATENSDLGFAIGDVASDALNGTGKFKEKLPLVSLATLYSSPVHIVTLAGKGIKNVADFKGKRISTGAPNSGTESMALRILEAYGIDPDKGIKRDRIGASESAGALKDGKIDAYFWTGGVPTASVLELASSPGTKIVLISHGEAVDKMIEKYGNVYFKGTIPKGVYPGVDEEVSVAAVGNMLVSHEKLDSKLAYNVVKAIFEHLPELEAIHSEAKNITLQGATVGSPLRFHEGAIQYYKEKGISL
jgi:uncharacterized protein